MCSHAWMQCWCVRVWHLDRPLWGNLGEIRRVLLYYQITTTTITWIHLNKKWIAQLYNGGNPITAATIGDNVAALIGLNILNFRPTILHVITTMTTTDAYPDGAILFILLPLLIILIVVLIGTTTIAAKLRLPKWLGVVVVYVVHTFLLLPLHHHYHL